MKCPSKERHKPKTNIKKRINYTLVSPRLVICDSNICSYIISLFSLWNRACQAWFRDHPTVHLGPNALLSPGEGTLDLMPSNWTQSLLWALAPSCCSPLHAASCPECGAARGAVQQESQSLHCCSRCRLGVQTRRRCDRTPVALFRVSVVPAHWGVGHVRSSVSTTVPCLSTWST